MVETLGEAWTSGWRVRVHCMYGLIDHGHASRKCGWQHELEMPTLIATRGRDFPLARLAERLRCPRCGCRDLRVFYLMPGDRDAGASRKRG